MSITKKFLKTRASCKVKFSLTAEEAQEASAVYLVGDFNNWNDISSPMKKRKDGSFYIEVELPSGRDCQFRYRTSDNIWLNDADADAHMPCAYACADNSLVKV